MKIKKQIISILNERYRKTVATATLSQLYDAVAEALVENVREKWETRPLSRRAAYFSAEFLMGRMIYSNLLNANELENVSELLKENGRDINEFEQIEDAALGNGGLGRLAACFLDSAATQKIALDGYGIRYKYGFFKQEIENLKQTEYPDDWTKFGDPFSTKCEEDEVTVTFGREKVKAVPYDTPVIGYGKKTVNNLRLWEAKAENEFDFSLFDKGLYDRAVSEKTSAENLSRTLYPNDNTDKGKKLRLKQEYFFCSASIQDMIRKLERNSISCDRFAEFYSIQLNDTHPATAILELVYRLCEKGIKFNFALDVAKGTFAYTNHTVLPEALEKYNLRLFKSTLPHLYNTLVKINNTLLKELRLKNIDEEKKKEYSIIDGDTIHMARLCIFVCKSINGVAKIHTEIIKHKTLKNWYDIYPERFNNKTNGITQRRWLMLSNPELSNFITQRIGDRWIYDLKELEKLKPYSEDDESVKDFLKIKDLKKKQLADELEKNYGIVLDPDFIFDTQVKRIHEYKRQLLNVLSVLDTYLRIKNGELSNYHPTAFLIGGKSAPGYKRAKDIIHLINTLSKKINSDPETSSLIKLHFLKNYNVSFAEKIIPATNISQQISTAGFEASGTGNMKFMLNGAVTLGTLDGANIEIVNEAGEENNFIFGLRVEQIEKMRETYDPMQIYEENERIRKTLDCLVDGTLQGDFKELYDSLLFGAHYHKPDNYFLLADFISYCDTREKANENYKDIHDFTKKCLLNTASAGTFSSDRTVKQYARDIWKV